jgi:hypothetical protein
VCPSPPRGLSPDPTLPVSPAGQPPSCASVGDTFPNSVQPRCRLTMAQTAMPRHRATQSQSGIGAPLYQRRQQSNAGPIELIPNPEFSFPMRDPDTASSAPAPTSSRPMSMQAYPTGRRGSMPHRRQKSISALPDFTFNPAGTPKPAKESTPPHSPNTLGVPVSPSKPLHPEKTDLVVRHVMILI